MTGDFGGYRAILDEAREIEKEERERPEVACPVCGTPLDFNSRGIGNCPMGHYQQTSPNQKLGTAR